MDQVSEVDGRSYSGDESSCGGNGPGKQLRHVFTLTGQFANKPDCGQSSRGQLADSDFFNNGKAMLYIYTEFKPYHNSNPIGYLKCSFV